MSKGELRPGTREEFTAILRKYVMELCKWFPSADASRPYYPQRFANDLAKYKDGVEMMEQHYLALPDENWPADTYSWPFEMDDPRLLAEWWVTRVEFRHLFKLEELRTADRRVRNGKQRAAALTTV